MGGEGGVEEKKNEKAEEGIGLGDGGVGGGGSGLLGLDPLLQSVFLFFLFFIFSMCYMRGVLPGGITASPSPPQIS